MSTNVTESLDHPVTVFVISWGRPIYLWACLDALWRFTRSNAHIILVNNFHPDPLVENVIKGFDRRGLFSEIVRFRTNSFDNIKSACRERLRNAGPFHVYMESDAVLCERKGCWLAEMRRIMQQNPRIGMLGSLVETSDFVDPATALRLAGGDADKARFLAKLESPERAFRGSSDWADPERDFFYTEPPCPIGNPPGRLLMFKTECVRDAGMALDGLLAETLRRRGMRPALTARVRHRHLSLLNIFDHADYDNEHRDKFFAP